MLSISSRVRIQLLSVLAGTLFCSTAFAQDFHSSSASFRTFDNPSDTVNIANTNVKWQSIGNCWAYATLGWAESLVLTATGGSSVLNLSETYHTYRHFELQLKRSWLTEVQTGGGWSISSAIINNFGVMNEGDFIPNESTNTFSATQKRAVGILNESLKNGALKSDRSDAMIRTELDRAFGVNLSAVANKIQNASSLIVGTDTRNRPLTLGAAISSWRETRWPSAASLGSGSLSSPDTTAQMQKNALLKRVKKALNDGKPVVMNWFVDFNALDSSGIFSAENLASKGKSGSQGYHQTVIEDYVVEGVNPATGEKFSVGEGEASPELKRLAADYGEIKYFVVKNSWGGDERLDRSSYLRDGSKGFTRLEASYIFSVVAQVDAKTNEFSGSDTTLNGFILPPGY